MDKVYRFDSKPLSTHMIVLEQIPNNSKVLEIGTASGYMGEYLVKEKKCTMWGVEPVGELCKDAEKCGYVKLYNTSVEKFLEQVNPMERFDIIIMADVLEHMVEPAQVLRQLSELLTPEGRMVISLPNVAHHTIRRHLLLGRWRMSDSGILDRTHLRFFNRYTAESMINSAGLIVEKIFPTVRVWKTFDKMWPFFGKRFGAWLSNIFGYQHVFVAKKV